MDRGVSRREACSYPVVLTETNNSAGRGGGDGQDDSLRVKGLRNRDLR